MGNRSAYYPPPYLPMTEVLYYGGYGPGFPPYGSPPYVSPPFARRPVVGYPPHYPGFGPEYPPYYPGFGPDYPAYYPPQYPGFGSNFLPHAPRRGHKFRPHYHGPYGPMVPMRAFY